MFNICGMNVYGLIGYPLTHSFSKKYFDAKFKSENISNAQFKLFDMPSISQLTQLLQQETDLKGFAITIPYKEQIIPYLHQTNAVVQQIKACNCVKMINNQLHGFNTDVLGFKQMLLPLLKPQHTQALILGTGGAAKAVQFVLEELNISYQYVSRNQSNTSLTYEALSKEIIEQHMLIINCTPLGTFPAVEQFPAIPYQYINSQHLLVDLVYNPPQTSFMQKGLLQGATVCNGYNMLVLQAAENWKIWNQESSTHPQ